MVDFKTVKNERTKFVRDFFRNNSIEGFNYYICGEGDINTPFDKSEKRNIVLFIEDNEENRINLEKHIKKTKKIKNLLELKTQSSLLKEFQNECIKRNIIINLHKNH